MRRTAIALVPALPDATPTIDEMGIPVAAVEWGVPVHCDETVQRQIIQRAFGENIARSVPTMGARPVLPTVFRIRASRSLAQIP